MARPKNMIPKPFIRQRRNSWQIRWTYDEEEYAMSVNVASKEEARVLCAVVAVALAGKDDWPVELIGMPAVRRYLARKTGVGVHDDDKKLIEQYADHLRIDTTRINCRFFRLGGSPLVIPSGSTAAFAILLRCQGSTLRVSTLTTPPKGYGDGGSGGDDQFCRNAGKIDRHEELAPAHQRG